ncbi:hypothetical protein GCM10010451_55520 [Streptomyces virens]|uniref:Uncharacterized protein n=1 Tax=Streptomyces virens TaxID=285572 RepID=A0ABP6PZU3_9ACTN
MQTWGRRPGAGAAASRATGAELGGSGAVRVAPARRAVPGFPGAEGRDGGRPAVGRARAVLPAGAVALRWGELG